MRCCGYPPLIGLGSSLTLELRNCNVLLIYRGIWYSFQRFPPSIDSFCWIVHARKWRSLHSRCFRLFAYWLGEKFVFCLGVWPPKGSHQQVDYCCLNALMQEQVAKFTSRGMTAVHVGSECSTLADTIINGEVQLTYTSPETILMYPVRREMFWNQHYQENLVCVVVDETH